MCLAIPMQIEAIDGLNARCQAKGVQREVSLFMLQDDPPGVGDHVMIQLGYAIRRVTEDEARASWELFDQILAEITPD
ncbi:MAG: HypC/HybG/HupF family hydrogenase formation chaperone [Hydrogenophilales bacterium]|jgi:hydrogenase expression/formation protein HypC|nr:HypC/HybG/HupF family hydrogenase formation chaperone [Hydrogenophilales bacterium]